jgi:membrane dipeptidase
MWIVDGHLDLGMNKLWYNRDLTRPLSEIRSSEGGAHPDVGTSTVTLSEMSEKKILLCFATLIALPFKAGNKSFAEGYKTPEQARQQAMDQVAYYRKLDEQGVIRFITSLETLDAQVAEVEAGRTARVGLILLMEGADPIVRPEDMGQWHDAGLRLIGPAWYGEGRYVHGTGTPGPFKAGGRELLKAMEEAGMVLDASHLAEEAFYEAMDWFGGTILASHSNARALVPGDRQISDDMIRKLIERDAVIGAVLDCWMLQPGWSKTKPNTVQLTAVADHIDHVCQLAGNTNHSAIGSDLDGGFGREQSPADLNTIGDLHIIADILRTRGYGDEDINKINHGNWLRLIRSAWS